VHANIVYLKISLAFKFDLLSLFILSTDCAGNKCKSDSVRSNDLKRALPASAPAAATFCTN